MKKVLLLFSWVFVYFLADLQIRCSWRLVLLRMPILVSLLSPLTVTPITPTRLVDVVMLVVLIRTPLPLPLNLLPPLLRRLRRVSLLVLVSCRVLAMSPVSNSPRATPKSFPGRRAVARTGLRHHPICQTECAISRFAR